MKKPDFGVYVWTVIIAFPLAGLSVGVGVGLVILCVATALRWAGWT